jgi:DNA mismatch repair protein MutS2
MVSTKVLKALEFDKILLELKSFAASDVAAERALSIVPATSLTQAETLLNETNEADKVLYQHAKSPNFAIDDISEALVRASKLSVLSIPELLRVARLLKVSRNLKFIGKLPEIKLLKEKTEALYENLALEEDIFKAFPSDNEVADAASPELAKIRSKIRKCNENIKSKLNQYITSPSYLKYLQDALVTIREDRYVIPVKSEYKGSVSGLVHDQSASGATLYVEPFAVVELNNELKTLLAEEKSEIEKILKAFTAEVASLEHELSLAMEIIVDLDAIFCRAMLAKKYNAVMPVLNDEGKIFIERGRHPLIDRAKVVPVTLKVGGDFDMLLITGPNTGGKTVTLKLAGLFAIMAVSGMFLPAGYAEISVFDNIFSDIGDEQSIEQSLSTFSAHIKNIKGILEEMTSNSLLLLDELGAGTDPSEGAALAVAISEYILESGAKAIITTHFNDLKEFALSRPRVENASMDFDVDTFAPTFRLIMGAVGASNALKIAKRLGLKGEVIESAAAKMSAERRDFENILLSAETARKQAEQITEEARLDREEAQRLLNDIARERNYLAQQREKMNENIRKETKRLIEKSVFEAEAIVDEIKEILEKGEELEESDLFAVRKLKKQLEKLSAEYEREEIVIEVEEEDSPAAEGDAVYVKSLGKSGIVKSIGKNGAAVKIGNVVMQIREGDYFKIKKERIEKPSVTAMVKRGASAALKAEIMLLGQTVEEAIYNVDTFLAEAANAGLNEVRVVHGKGSGKLRQELRRHFQNHPFVLEFRDGRYGEGDTGVTIVTLK